MLNFDRAFEGAIGWIATLVILLSLTYSALSSSGEYDEVPQSITRTIEGKKHECFDTENYRKIVQYVQVIVPALVDQNTTLGLTLDAAYDEHVGLIDTRVLLEHKLDIMRIDLLATTTELDDIKLQIKKYRKVNNRAKIAHYLIHGAAFIAVVSLGTAYGLERVHD